MAPVVFVDSRERLPRAAVTTINLSARENPVWVIKPGASNKEQRLSRTVNVVDPRDIRGAKSAIREFRGVYEHLSTNTVDYERSCFERFVIIDLWACESGVIGAWHFDTDAWAATNLGSLIPPESSHKMVAGLPNGLNDEFPSVTVSQAYIPSRVLRRFSEYLIEDFFSTRREELTAWFTRRRELSRPGGVSDMMAWGAFLKASSEVDVRNSFTTRISGYLLIDTLYQLVEQLNAMKSDPAYGGLALVPTSHGLILRNGSSTLEVAGVHLAGADKGLIFPLASGRKVTYMGLTHRYRRASHRTRRRLARVTG